MKYAVEVAGREFTVEFTPDGLKLDGEPVDARLIPDGAEDVYRLFVEDRGTPVEVRRANGGWKVQVAGEHRDVEVVDERIRRLRELTGADQHGGGEVIKAPMPGMVLRLEVEVGQEVTAGQGVLVLEAMKMENEIRAGAPGVVTSIRAEAGTAVEKGTVLVEIGPPEQSASS